MRQSVAVIGLGEVEKPLFDLLAPHHNTVGIDVDVPNQVDRMDVIYVCYPFEIADFSGHTTR